MSNQIAEQVLAIDFVTAETAGSEVLARLDDKMNGEKTSFAYKSTAYFQVFSNPADLGLTIETSDGTVGGAGSGSETFSEFVGFAGTNRGRLTVPAESITSTRWLGTDLGTVTHLGGTELQSSRSGVGYLKITYTARFRRYGLTVADPRQTLAAGEDDVWPVLVRVQGVEPDPDEVGPSTSLEIEFYGESQVFTDYTLHVVDACTDEAIQGVSVAVDGESLLGVTGSDGSIAAGSLRVGSTHTARVSHGGYDLFEAEFTVPEPADDEAAC